MRTAILRALAALAAFVALHAGAAITCSVSSGGFLTAYNPSAPGNNVTQTFFTVTCTRGLAGDPTSVNFGVTVNNGLNPQGQNNRAQSGTNLIRYDVFKDAGCGTKWKGATSISGTLNMPTTGTFTAQGTYYGCVGPGLASPAGTYTDTIVMTLTYGPLNLVSVGSFGASISTPATCSLSSAPGTLTFNYTSFGVAVNPSVAFGVTCTLALPYSMALDATAGTSVGLAYTLALSSANSVGTGAQQTHSVNGSMAAGQAGTCAGPGTCSATATRVITITY